MYSDEKKPESLVQVYEVSPSIEASQPKPRRPLWRRIVAVFLIISALLMLRSAFTPFSCSKSYDAIPVYSGEPDQPEQPARRLKFDFPSNLRDFKISQITQSILPTRTEVFGRVHVGSSSSAKNITVYVTVKSSDTANFDKVKFEKKDWGLEFAADVTSITKQYINVTAYVVVPANDRYKLSSFTAETRELGIALRPTFKTMVNTTHLHSISGNIVSYGYEARDVLHSLHLYAKSDSGNIWGRYGLGRDLHFETKSGEVGVNVTNASFMNGTAHLSTTTISGNNKIQFANSLRRPLRSDHKSVSGWIRIGYPNDWSGSLDMKSVSGHLKIIGTGTQIVKKHKGLEGRFIKAVKGNGNSRASLSSVSGDINVGIGEYNETPGGGKHNHHQNSAPAEEEEEMDCDCCDEDDE